MSAFHALLARLFICLIYLPSIHSVLRIKIHSGLDEMLHGFGVAESANFSQSLLPLVREHCNIPEKGHL